MSNIMQIGDGKYAIEYDEEQHRLRTYRHGEYWNEETGNKFLYYVWEELRKLKQERDELAAQVSKAKEFIQMLANSSPADDMDSTPFDAQEFLDSFPTGPDALREVKARTLEEAAHKLGGPAARPLLAMAAAIRKGE